MRPGSVPRKKDFKKGIDADDARRKREDNIIELRKTKRDENLQKKRQVNVGPSYAMEDSTTRTAGAANKVSCGLPLVARAAAGPTAPSPTLLPCPPAAATGRAARACGWAVRQRPQGPV